MREIVHGTIQAALHRGQRVALRLTGGIDSRTLLACAGESRTQLHCFTLVDTATALHDVWIPWRLASRMKLTFRFIWSRRLDDATVALMRATTGFMWRDPNEHRTAAFGLANGDLVLLGTVSEVCRCFYYKNGIHPENVTAAHLAEVAGWGDDADAISAYDEWLAGIPVHATVNILDLFYWESRLGNWAAMDALALDAFADGFSPFNCRELLEAGLGVDVAHRRAPYSLHRQICQSAAPETLELAINTTWPEAAVAFLRRLTNRVFRRLTRIASSTRPLGARGD
jgi:hypothetical protein